MTSNPLHYRPEIDGLRAIAVVGVILYHAQFTLAAETLLKGGYLGVDIFFVISGYLITRIILVEIYGTRSFCFLHFYERRARRILPTLFVVILCTLPLAWFRLLPPELEEYAKSVLSSMAFSSNIFFYVETTRYGAESALLKPFLHTWSLGVEEQFYLIFPFFALSVYAVAGRKIALPIVTLSLGSLLLAHYVQPADPEFAFYLPMTRFWELAVGALLAHRELTVPVRQAGTVRRWLPALGVAIIVVSILLFDDRTRHPGLFTTLPIIGTMMIIAYASERDATGRILGSKPFIWVGLLSYSAYLWHFPLFALARIRDSATSNQDMLWLIAMTAGLSVLSFFLVERPFRKSLPLKTFLASLSFMAFLIVFPLAYVAFGAGFEATWQRLGPRHLTEPYPIIQDASADRPQVSGACLFTSVRSSDIPDMAEHLERCRRKFGPSVVILGDSHAINVYNMFGYSGRYPFLVGIVQPGCRPYRCGRRWSDHYAYFVDEVLPLLSADDVVIFHQSGSHLVKDRSGKNDSQLAFDEGVFEIDRGNIEYIEQFLDELATATPATVKWLGPFVEYRFNPKKIVEMSANGIPFDDLLRVNPNSTIIFRALENYLLSRPHARYSYISFQDFYKTDTSAFLSRADGSTCFRFADRDHFSRCGEEIVGAGARYGFARP